MPAAQSASRAPTLDRLAIEAATDLLTLARCAPAAMLRRAAEIAGSAVPGCGGATVNALDAGESRLAAASHAELVPLVEAQLARGEGPVPTALREGGTTAVPDTLQEDRWPAYAAAALRAGVRASVTTVRADGRRAIACTLYSLRAGGLDPDGAHIAEAIAGCALAALDSADALDNALTDARQSREMAASRGEIERAKGMLMQALGCDADTAFTELSQASQHSQRKITEVARHLVNRGIAPARGRD